VPQGISPFAEIALPVAVHGTFTYSIPENLRDSVRLGSRVEVPLGPKLSTGFVVGLIDESSLDTAKVKAIRSVLDEDEPALTREIIDLCRWGAEYYIAPLGEMLRVALPANMASRGKREAVLTGDNAMVGAALNEKRILESDLDLVRELRNRPLPLSMLPRSAIERLRGAGIIATRDRLFDAKGVRYDRFVGLEEGAWARRRGGAAAASETRSGGGADAPLFTEKQQRVLDLLASRGGEMSVAALEHAGVSAAVLSALAKKNAVRIERRARRHTLDAFLAGLDPAGAPELRYSSEQRDSIEAIKTLASHEAFGPIQAVT